MDKDKIYIFGIPFYNATLKETIQTLVNRVLAGEATQVVTANPELVMSALENSVVMNIMQHADIITPDGGGVVLASRKWGIPLKERVPGYDVLHGLMNEANDRHWRVFLYGAKLDVNMEALMKLKEQYPGAIIEGQDGFVKPEEQADLIQQLKQFDPHLLFVGLGHPRQEQWIYEHKPTLSIPVMMGVGGSFDVLAGRVERAPAIWQKFKIEWLYRLIQEPSRWRRMLAIPRFVGKVLITSRKKNTSRQNL